MHGVVNVIFVRPCSVLLQEAATTKLCRSFGRREWLLKKKQQAFVKESDDAMTEMFTHRPTVHTSSTSPSAASSAAIKKINE